MEYMLMPLKRYADFSGRSRRKEYWMFFLLVVVVYFILAFIGGGFAAAAEEPASAGFGSILLIVFMLAILIPSLAVQVRRFHDQDKSGWFVLLNFIPFLGGIIVLVFMCIEGTQGPNQYGPDPKAGVDPEAFA